MDLNSFLFPAPKSSYSTERISGELIWIPKNPKLAEGEGFQPTVRQNTAPELGSAIAGAITYHAQLLKLKNLVTVADTKFKPKSVDPEMDEVSFITTETSKRPGLTGEVDFNEGFCGPAENNQFLPQAFGDGQLLADLHENPSSKQFQTEKFENMVQTAVTEEPKTNLVTDYYTRGSKTSILEREGLKGSFNFQATLQKTPEKKPDPVEKLPPINRGHKRGDLSMTSFDLGLLSERVNPRFIPVSTPKSMQNYASTQPLSSIQETASPVPREKIKQYCNFDDLDDHVRETDGPMPNSPNPKSDLLFKELSESSQLNSEEAGMNTERMNLQDLKPPGYDKLLKQRTQVENCSSDGYIPCNLLRAVTSTSKIMIYFHGNGEDINLAYELLSHARNNLNVNILAVEYPGYGLYEGTASEANILEDSERVYDYLVDFLKVNPRDIIIFGRSIGSGPATHLASIRNVGALILMSAFTSIKSVIRGIAGSLAGMLFKERFNNIQTISKVSAPIFLIHGQKDRLIPYQHSEKLHDACRVPCELLLPKNMDHIEFDFDDHFAYPLIQFLARCGIRTGCYGYDGKIFFPKKLFEVPDHVRTKLKQSLPKKASSNEEEKKRLLQLFSALSDNKHLSHTAQAQAC